MKVYLPSVKLRIGSLMLQSTLTKDHSSEFDTLNAAIGLASDGFLSALCNNLELTLAYVDLFVSTTTFEPFRKHSRTKLLKTAKDYIQRLRMAQNNKIQMHGIELRKEFSATDHVALGKAAEVLQHTVVEVLNE